jgi:hypothetical protein
MINLIFLPIANHHFNLSSSICLESVLPSLESIIKELLLYSFEPVTLVPKFASFDLLSRSPVGAASTSIAHNH